MGVGWHVPGYLLREELQRDKLRGRAGMRTWSYERKLEEGREGGNEKQSEGGKSNGRMGERGWRIEEVERLREVRKLRGEELYEREKRRQSEGKVGKNKDDKV